jgi:hypothetical protein
MLKVKIYMEKTINSCSFQFLLQMLYYNTATLTLIVLFSTMIILFLEMLKFQMYKNLKENRKSFEVFKVFFLT